MLLSPSWHCYWYNAFLLHQVENSFIITRRSLALFQSAVTAKWNCMGYDIWVIFTTVLYFWWMMSGCDELISDTQWMIHIYTLFWARTGCKRYWLVVCSCYHTDYTYEYLATPTLSDTSTIIHQNLYFPFPFLLNRNKQVDITHITVYDNSIGINTLNDVHFRMNKNTKIYVHSTI